MSSAAEIAEVLCAYCGKSEENNISLKTCIACKMTKYCSRDCQVAHRPQHKKACKKRAAELYDEELFRDPKEREDCPICMICLPVLSNQISFQECCGKIVCMGCIYAQRKEDSRSGKREDELTCAFCRAPEAATDEEFLTCLENTVKKNNPNGINMLASFYMYGEKGLPRDVTKAKELYLKAGELGCGDGYYNLSNIFSNDGPERDIKKERQYLELGTIAGDVYSRHNLGALDWGSGSYERACKHFMISAKGGNEMSLEHLKVGFKRGYITKDQYTETLRAYQQHKENTKSAMRDEYLAYNPNHIESELERLTF